MTDEDYKDYEKVRDDGFAAGWKAANEAIYQKLTSLENIIKAIRRTLGE